EEEILNLLKRDLIKNENNNNNESNSITDEDKVGINFKERQEKEELEITTDNNNEDNNESYNNSSQLNPGPILRMTKRRSTDSVVENKILSKEFTNRNQEGNINDEVNI